MPFFIMAAFGPFFAAVIVVRIVSGKKGLRAWLKRVFNLRIPVALYLTGAFFLPAPDDVLNGLGTFMFLRGVAYWTISGVIIILTRGRLGYIPEKPEGTSAVTV